MTGEEGDDTLRGEAGSDVLNGGSGNDSLDGGGNSDTLTGGMGEDVIKGGAGSDLIDGGEDRDNLFGGLARDTFVLMTDLTSSDRDTIRDFELGKDRLGVANLSVVDELSIANNANDTASIITNSNNQQVAVLAGITNVTLDDFTFVEI